MHTSLKVRTGCMTIVWYLLNSRQVLHLYSPKQCCCNVGMPTQVHLVQIVILALVKATWWNGLAGLPKIQNTSPPQVSCKFHLPRGWWLKLHGCCGGCFQMFSNFDLHNKMCVAIVTFLVKHQHKTDWELNLLWFNFGHQESMFVGFFNGCIVPSTCVHYWMWSNQSNLKTWSDLL